MTDYVHLWCSNCETQPTVARLDRPGESPVKLVCDCTHDDGFPTSVPLTFSVKDTRLPPQWEFRGGDDE